MEKQVKKKINKVKKGSANNKFIWVIVIVAFLLSLIVFLGVFSWQIYQLNSQSQLTMQVSKVIPFPAARVNNHFISYYDYLKNIQAVKTFYDQQKLPVEKPNDFNNYILEDRLINNILVKDIARDYNIQVTQADIEEEINRIIANKGSREEVEEFLDKYYDLTIEEYEEYFTEPNLYYLQVEMALTEDEELNGQAKEDIQRALNSLRNNENFNIVAQDYQASVMGREVYRGELPQMIEEELYAMEEGEYTDAVSLPGSWQIMKIVEKDEQIGVLTLDIIIVPTVSLAEVLTEKRQQADIEVYIY